MSKVISFSISDRYLDKLRSLYPALTDNLAVKQFVTDRLDSSLGNSLDGSLDDGLDDRVKTLIESWVDGLLEVRLDASVGKLITSLSERMARLEARLDDNLDGSLDDMERLLRLQRESSIATSPLPTIEETSPLPNQDTVETAIDTVESVDEPDKGAIGPVPCEGDSIEPGKGEGMNAADAHRYLTAKGVKVSEKTLSDWISKKKHIPMTGKGDAVSEYLILRDGRYFPNPD